MFRMRISKKGRFEQRVMRTDLRLAIKRAAGVVEVRVAVQSGELTIAQFREHLGVLQHPPLRTPPK